ncbi:C-C chemokine receptor type 9a isoform X35 [Epinephelus moara]|uniref:C-C chemokine receptor type 9a isoform X35 n=1 Tax=Epinephelus moara TaxID=300413 RepID=UPI00214ECAE3|nr:C-C chemokine receptor type 9a isoform X35 [Epinephelus moara]
MKQQQVCPGVFRCAQVCSGVSRCGQVCPGVLRCAQVCSGVSRCVQVCSGVSRCAQVCPGVLRCVQVYSGVSSCVQVWSGVSRCVQVCPGVFRCVQVCSSVFRCVQVCPVVFSCLQVCSGVSSGVQLSPGVFRCVHVCSGVSRCVQMCPGVFRCVQVYSGVSRCIQVCPGVVRCVQMCPGVFRCVQVYSGVSNCVQVCSGVSSCVQVCPGVFRCVQVCSSVSRCVQWCSAVSRCVQVCACVLRCVQVYSGVSRCVQVCPGVVRCVQMCPGVFRCVQLFPGVLRCVQVWSDVFRCVQLCPGVLRYVQVCPVVFRCVQVCPSVSKCVQVCPSVSRCAQVCSGVSRCAQVCSGVSRCVQVCSGVLRCVVSPLQESFSISPSPTAFDDDDYEDLFCDQGSVREFRSHYEPPLFWIITVVGGAGNLAVVWIYLNFRRRLKTMTDVYLLNLAVADLLFLITLPLWADEAMHGWSFGSALCKVNSALYKVNLFSSMLLLTCISVDRYVVIVQSTKARNSQVERRRCSTLMCVGVWLLALLLALPEFMFATTSEVDSREYCRMVFPHHVGNRTKILVLSLQVSMGFCLPFFVMVFCYSIIVAKLLKTRNFQKHKAMRVILAVVVVFIVSQLPHNGVLVMQATQASSMTMTDCEEMKRFNTVEQVLKSLAYMHACLNPFLYAFVGVRFRRDMLQLLRVCRCQPPANKSQLSKSCRSPLNSTRASVMSDSDTSQALSL